MIRPVAQQDLDRLRVMLKDKDEWVRRRAAESLLSAGVRDPEAELIIHKELWGGHTWGAQAPGGVSDWIALLASQNRDANIRAGAADALRDTHIYRSDIEEAFIQAIDDPSSRVRDAARFALLFTMSEAAKDALLRDEIAEVKRQRAAEERARTDRTRPHTLAEILKVIPPDPDNASALDVANQFETKAADGTVVLTVLHSGLQRPDLLRIWTKRNSGYFLVWEDNANDPDGGTPHLSVAQFQYGGIVYIHIMRLWEGTGFQHEDKYFRAGKGGLVPLKTPQGLPVHLAAKEGVWKGSALHLTDDHLDFQFWIWNEGDANCCPTAGTVIGTYTIVGDELRYATWKRSAVNQQ